jgi:two-component system response regulator FixJ
MTSTADKPAPGVVCLVDDDSAVRRSIGRLLSSDGLSLCTFDKPRNFLTYARANPVSVVVLDIWMEEMNGLEVQAEVSEFSPATRVIIITGREDPKAQRKALQAGAVAFFLKPFHGDAFLAAIHDALHVPQANE